jgi:phage I-like protein
LAPRSPSRLVYALPGQGETPCEFRIFAFGKTDTENGAYSFDQESADVCMDAFKTYGNRLTIDYEHQALNDPPTGPAPAAASFVPEMRADGLWATDVRWTERASSMLKAKEYLYYSPAFLHDDDGRPTRLLNVALTNLPATRNMTPLVAAKFTQETTMKTVLTALSLKESASEAEALSAVTRISDDRRQLLTVTGKDSVAEALGVVAAWKQSADEVETLRASVLKAAKEQSDKDFDAEISTAKKSGFLAASDEHKRNKQALSYKGKDDQLVALRGFIGALDPLIPGAPVASKVAASEPSTGETSVTLTAEEKRIANKMGLKHEDVLKNKVRRLELAKQPKAIVADDDDDDKDAA